MRLPTAAMLPSYASLRDYGNTSCSTTWYVLAYMETADNVKRGQTIMQIGMGGGMKAGVNVWRALRTARSTSAASQLAILAMTERSAGLMVSKVLPDALFVNWPPINACEGRLTALAIAAISL